MGLLGNFFQQRKPRHFEYQPRCYDVEKEERRQKLNAFRVSQGKEPILDDDKGYVSGEYIKGNFRSSNLPKKTKTVSFSRIAIFGIILVVLIFLMRSNHFQNLIMIFFN